MNSFVIADPNKCIGCRTCMIACVVEHSNENIFTQDPYEINFNPKLEVVKTSTVSVPIQCRHCEDAPCVNVCPNGGLVKENGAVKVIEEKCVGCKTCMIACPIGAIDLVSLKEFDDNKLCFMERVKANKCDLCINSENGPACVRVCPTKAFKIVKDESLTKDIKDKRKLATSLI